MKMTAHLLATLIMLAAATTAFAAGPSVDCVPSSPAVMARSLVFTGGDGVSKFYRIPAVVVAPDGSIMAVADRRLDTNKDLPARIDVVGRRSTDGGATWGETIEIAVNDSVGGFGDPGLGVAPDGSLVVVMTHGNGLWESTRSDHASIWTAHSTDNGATWSRPVDITSGLFASDGTAPVDAVGAFATSGRIATLKDGRMMFCLVARPFEQKWSKLQVYPVESRDNGRSWSVIPVSVDDDADESKIVERPDGSLLMSIRNRRQGYRKFSTSTDGGRSWSEVVKSTTLPDPACNGDIIAYRHRGRNYLLHSVPDSHNARRDVSLFASDDAGATWRKLITLCPAPSVYSAITELPDHTLGCLVEENNSAGGQRIWFTRLDVASLIDKQFAQ